MKTQSGVNYFRVTVLIMVLFLSGCGANMQTLTYDGPVQEGQSAVLLIPETYTVTNFDGRQVKWKAKSDFFAVFGNYAAIRLPSGPHSFTYRYVRHEVGQTTVEHYSSGAVVQRTTPSKTISFDETVTINMEPGKTYKFEGCGIVIDTSGSYQQLP
jgi:hypothetical protein